jgi:hypothetical protein
MPKDKPIASDICSNEFAQAHQPHGVIFQRVILNAMSTREKLLQNCKPLPIFYSVEKVILSLPLHPCIILLHIVHHSHIHNFRFYISFIIFPFEGCSLVAESSNNKRIDMTYSHDV